MSTSDYEFYYVKTALTGITEATLEVTFYSGYRN